MTRRRWASEGCEANVPLQITIIQDDCIECGLCISVCPASPCVFEVREGITAVANPEACEECMLCIDSCPTDAIKMAKDDME
jgi:NAD-dependent dihydropyrimidine dehydrogenase PreA subunit